MANFDDKILYLKTLMVEEGVGEVLERLKSMLLNNKQKLNELIQLEGILRKMNKDFGFEFITKDQYDTKLANLRNTLLDFLDNLKLEDLQSPTERKANNKKKNHGYLLHRIPKEMQLFKRTKCVIRLANVMEDLLENYKMTDDTVIKSVRVAEVMEVDLQDRNADTAFEITTPNDKEQFLDDDDFTEWIFYAKPIRDGQHELTLVITVLEEVKGKERRRNVVLEEVVTIVAEEIVIDEVYKSTGYEINSTELVESKPFLGFMQSIRKYSAIIAFMLLGTLGTWALGTENGQYQIARIINTEASYGRFIEKYDTNKNSKRVEDARWKKAVIIDTDESYEEYLKNTTIRKYEKIALELITKEKTSILEEDVKSEESTIIKEKEEKVISENVTSVNRKKDVKTLSESISNNKKNKGLEEISEFVYINEKNEISEEVNMLDSFDLTGRGLTNIPEYVYQNEVIWLNLTNNFIRKLPEKIKLLNKLQVLGLNRNNLIFLPKEIKYLTRLKKLDLSSNFLETLPPEIGLLSNLTGLDLSSNSLKTLPVEIGLLNNLIGLDLSSNSLETLPPEIGLLNNLTGLDLSSNSLKALPPEISSLNNLTGLDLGSNQLSRFPSEINKLENLLILNLSSNNLNYVTNEVAKLISLYRLDLSLNSLSSLPVEIGQLTNLKLLDLRYNNFSKVEREKIESLLPNCTIYF